MYYEVNLEIDYKAIGERVKVAREKREHGMKSLITQVIYDRLGLVLM